MSIPVWAMKLPWDAITAASYGHELSPKIIAAIVQTESAGNNFATRFEPNWKWFVEPDIRKAVARDLGITVATEEIHEATSWGLLQVMGSTARSTLNYLGPLPALCEIELGLELGCQYFRMLCDRHGSIEKAIVSYNAGSPRQDKATGKWVNQDYLDKVFAFLRDLG